MVPLALSSQAPRAWRWPLFLVLVLLLAGVTPASGAAKAVKFRFNAQFFKAYRTSEEIASYMKYLSIAKTNCSVTLLKIGYSQEGRPIRLLRVTGKGASRTGPIAEAAPRTRLTDVIKRGLLITAGVHGREWITPSALLYTVTRIIEAYGAPGHEDLTKTLDHSTLHIIPVVNPDGYRFTWNPKGNAVTMARFRLGTHTGNKAPRAAPNSRLWRGNRRKLGNGLFGVDLNRNWGSKGISWGEGVARPSSINYQGELGFSESETQTVRAYALRRDDVTAYLDVHCCMRSVRAPFALYPYDDKTALKVARVGLALVSAMQDAQGNPHRYEFRAKRREKFSSGLSTGWAFSEMGLMHSYTIELGGSFIMPATKIAMDGEELLAAALVAMNDAATSTDLLQPRLLAQGAFGEDVLQWQTFLHQQGAWPAKPKPGRTFGPICLHATQAWQAGAGLDKTGFLDGPTMKAAVARGFAPYERGMSAPARIRVLAPLVPEDVARQYLDAKPLKPLKISGCHVPSILLNFPQRLPRPALCSQQFEQDDRATGGDGDDDSAPDTDTSEGSDETVLAEDAPGSELDVAPADPAELAQISEFEKSDKVLQAELSEVDEVAGDVLHDDSELADSASKSGTELDVEVVGDTAPSSPLVVAIFRLGGAALLLALVVTLSWRWPVVRMVGGIWRTRSLLLYSFTCFALAVHFLP